MRQKTELPSKILHRNVQTPLDIERTTGLTEGNIFQGELSLEQLFFSRPVPGWARFRMAAATLIWHEIALAATAVGMLALTWGQPNQVAAIAFAILFVMRVSAKLNIFLGVPNLTVDFLPAHLAYLKSYFRIRIFNPMFPVSIAVASVATMLLAEAAAVAAPGAATGLTMLAVLAGLGCIEHWFLVLPFRDAALWRWAMSGTGPTSAGHVRQTRRLGTLP